MLLLVLPLFVEVVQSSVQVVHRKPVDANMSMEFQLVDQLREKLEDANLTKDQLEKLIPPVMLRGINLL